MADVREVFTILEDNATAAGVKLPARAEGAAVAGNHVPVAAAKDGAGNYQLVPIRAEGAAVAGNELPVLPAKDSGGNWAHIPLDASGRIPVSTFPSSAGTKISDSDTVVGVLNTATDIVVLTLAVATAYEIPQFIGAATFSTLWEVIWNDDGTEEVLGQFLTGPGQFSFGDRLEDVVFTSGATGTQELKLVATQLQGSATDMHGTLSIQTV